MELVVDRVLGYDSLIGMFINKGVLALYVEI